MHQWNVVVMPEQVDHGLGLVEAQQAVIDEHAGELAADRLMDQHGGNRRVHAAGEAANHPALADLAADLVDRFLAEGAHGPVAGEARDLAHEIPDQLGAVGGVHDFGMEHQPVIFAFLVLDHGERRIGGNARDHEAGRHPGDAVAMAHPDRMALADCPRVLEQAARPLHLDVGAAELAMVPALDLAAELGRHGHLAVADAEHGNTGVEDQLRGARGAFLVHRFRPAGEDHRFRLHLLERGFRLLERHDLAIDALLAHAAGNQLRHLAAEIDNQNLVMGRGHRGRRLAGLLWGCHDKQIRDGGRARNPGSPILARLVPAIHVFWRPALSFRDGPKDQTRDREILRCAIAHRSSPFGRPGMTEPRYDAVRRFKIATKNPSVPVRRGVISQPSGDCSAALANASALSPSAVTVSAGGTTAKPG